MGILQTHKGEVLAAVAGAIVGAALSAAFSMAVGLYSLTRSFEYAQNKELLASLRKDIEFLARIQNEVEVNTQLMVSDEYRISVTFSERFSLADLPMEDAKGKPKSEKEQRLISLMFGQGFVVLTARHVPREKLVVESWGTKFPDGGNIAFDLLSEINDYYRRVRQLNVLIDRIGNISPGGQFPHLSSLDMLKDVEYHNKQVEEFGKLNTVLLRQKIEREISRLSNERQEISRRVVL